MINVEPTKDHQMPYDMSDEKPATFKDELAVTANTLDIMEGLGFAIESTPEEAEKTKRLVTQALQNNKVGAFKAPTAAFAAKEFLKSYANQLALDVHEVRSAVTSKLMEIANCGDPKYELRALELLGKHSDIGLFTERSEITVNYKSSSDLEEAIKERVKRLLNADIIDITPIGDNLDEELGFADVGSFEQEGGPSDDETSTRSTE